MNKRNAMTIGFAVSVLLVVILYKINVEKVTAPSSGGKDNAVSETTTSTGAKIEKEPVATSTIKWQVYENEETDLSFSYPGDWAIEKTEKNSGAIKPLKPENCGPSGATCLDSILFELKINKDRLSILDFFKTLGWREGEDYSAIEETAQGDLKLYKFTETSAYDRSEGTSMWAQLPDGNFFAISGWYLVKSEPEILQKIFKSVKIK